MACFISKKNRRLSVSVLIAVFSLVAILKFKAAGFSVFVFADASSEDLCPDNILFFYKNLNK